MERTPKCRSRERGYILLTLILFVALLVIAAAAVAPEFAFQLRRDREEEMIHRGVQYSRAIRRYYKKFGRYPTRLEELENSNRLRFLRRRYKDPITGEDFKLLHFGEVQTFFGQGIAGGTPVGNMPGAQQGLGGLSGTSGATSGASTSRRGQGSGTGKSGQTFGGGPIVGVVSASKDETIREFNNKKHYNEWQFIYEPSLDRGGLLNTPAQKPLQGMGMGMNQQPQGGVGTPAGMQGQSMPQNPPPQPQPPEQE